MNRLTTLQEEALCGLIRVSGTDRVVLVGGAALTLLTGMPWRTTLDLDLVVVSEVADSDRTLARWEAGRDLGRRSTDGRSAGRSPSTSSPSRRERCPTGSCGGHDQAPC